MYISSLVTISSLLTLISALPQINPTTSSLSEGTLAERDSQYDRSGSAMCKSLQVKYCDEAVNNFLQRDDVLRYKPNVYGDCSGSCSALGAYKATGAGCRISVEGGSHCKASGNQLWKDYQDIRDHGASKCGGKTWGNGCKTKIDYVAECFKAKTECPQL